MKKTTKKGFVEIPKATLSALKGLLFDNNGGIDLSRIISDIAPNDDARELTAINVGLVYKGLEPKIDTTTRYECGYRSIIKYEYVGYSLILGIVKVHISRAYAHKDDNGNVVFDEYKEDNDVLAISYDMWEEYETNEQVIIDNIVKRDF